MRLLSGSWFAGVLASVLLAFGLFLGSLSLLVVGLLCGLMALCLWGEERRNEPKA